MKTINKDFSNFKKQELNEKEINKIVGGGGDPTNVVVTDPTGDPATSNKGGFAVSGRNNTVIKP